MSAKRKPIANNIDTSFLERRVAILEKEWFEVIDKDTIKGVQIGLKITELNRLIKKERSE